MRITYCPKCGSMNITTAGDCANCEWSQFAQVTTVSTRITDEIELKVSGKALLDDYKRLLLENRNLKERIAELEEQVWNLNLENERLEEAYWIDETISPDGTLKPSVRKLLERLEKAETDLRLSDDLVKALDNRIAKLEAENDQLTAHDATERQDDKCSKPEPNVCEACGGDGTVLLTDGYKGQVIATAKCIYCNGTGRVNKEREE